MIPAQWSAAERPANWRILLQMELSPQVQSGEQPPSTSTCVVLPIARVTEIRDWLRESSIDYGLTTVAGWMRISFTNEEDAILCRLAWS